MISPVLCCLYRPLEFGGSEFIVSKCFDPEKGRVIQQKANLSAARVRFHHLSSFMLVDIVEVKVLEGHNLYVKFEDGVEGQVDVSKVIPFKGIFSKLKDPAYFSTVKLNAELGTIVWDNGADLSSTYLYSLISKKAA